MKLIGMAKPNLGDMEKEAVNRVIDSGMIACGQVVSDFESEFARYIGADYGVATTSGTTALECALRAVGIGVGDKVITTPFTFIASTNAIVYVGATPVFADIDPDTFNIDPAALERVIENDPSIKAVLLVHLFGQPCLMEEIMLISNKYNLVVIEDCAQAHGAMINGQKVGSIGDISAFSFYPTKNMTTGEGGIVLTKNEKYAKQAKLLINHGMEIRYYHDIIGYNYRMTNIAAAIGLCQLDKLTAMNARRKKNAKFYFEHITNPKIKLPMDHEGHVYHQFTIKVDNREDFLKHLEKNQIGYGIFYPLSVPEQKCYKDFGFDPASYPVTNEIKNLVISIPIHPLLTEGELKIVADTINNFD